MPIYEYRCPDCSKITEELYLAGDGPAPQVRSCICCGSQSRRIISRSSMKLSWVPTVIDNGRHFDDTALEGVDGRNPMHVTESKPFSDIGARTPHGAKQGSRGVINSDTFP